MTKIVINDYEIGRSIHIEMNDDDFELLNNHWEKSDSLLIELQNNSYFKGKLRWCDLTSSQFRLMIISNLEKMSYLYNDDLENNEVAVSMRFLLSGLIKCIEVSAYCEVELLKVGRIDASNVLFDYVANMNLPFEKTSECKFTVVVDND